MLARDDKGVSGVERVAIEECDGVVVFGDELSAADLVAKYACGHQNCASACSVVAHPLLVAASGVESCKTLLRKRAVVASDLLLGRRSYGGRFESEVILSKHASGETRVITDADLRLNHEFVNAFEYLRKSYGYREMGDAALTEIAEATSVPYETIRIWRHLRNALAHGERVNRDQLATQILTIKLLQETNVRPLKRAPSAVHEERPGRAFRVHAWIDGRLEQEMIANGFISIGGDEIGDLADVTDREAIRSALTLSMPERGPGAIAIFVGYWSRVLWEAQPGDVIVLPLRDRTVAIGELTGGYHYVATPEARARHRRSVDWIATVDRFDLSDDLTAVLNSRHTLQEIKSDKALHALAGIVVSAE